jgi:hypothetical protein
MRFARVVLLGLLLMLPAAVASAQPIDVPPTRGGDLWSRPRLTGSWFGLRERFLRQQLDLGLNHDDVVEMYYNAALTAWLSATLDLQIVNPALKKAVNASGTGLKNVDTAVVGGIRLYVRF